MLRILISLECGRCRKRKIRCSGDNGTGEQCTNCRNAGASPCQFLRVSSQEATITLKQDSGFNYNLMDSREHHARGLTGLPSSQTSSVSTAAAAYHDASVSVSTMDAYQPYRNSQTYPYGPTAAAGGRGYLAWSAAPGYLDASSSQEQQHPDCSSSSSGGGYQHHSLYPATSYAPSHDSRYLPSSYQPGTATGPRPIAPYVDAHTAAYGYSAAQGTSTLAHRPAPGVETTNGVWYHHNVTPAAAFSSSAGSSSSSKVVNPNPLSSHTLRI
jgi:hypothetical protein